jgi:16S rRNA (guanine527-N7)-methyltransferase
VNRAPSADPAVPTAPPIASEVFGARLTLAESFAALLTSDAVARGLLGPREVPRLWERHLLNCAVLSDLLPLNARVVDVGSGAGLPGLVLAIRRPDLRVALVEPMLRRTRFLDDAVALLALGDTVRVVRGRADDAAVVDAVGSARWVVARAVAPLDRLVRWCLPLLATGGRLLALKGATAQEELAMHREELLQLGLGELTVRRLGDGVLTEPTWAVSARRTERPAGGPKKGGG